MFSLLTWLHGDSDLFLILFISTQNKLSMSVFWYDLNVQMFCFSELYGSKSFIL